MNLIKSLMPTTAELMDLAAKASFPHPVPSAPLSSVSSTIALASVEASAKDGPRGNEPKPVQLKYIIIQPQHGSHGQYTESVIIFSFDLQHSTMVPDCYIAVSAGFIMLYDGQLHIPQIDSTSLQLGPRPQDKAILAPLFQTHHVP